MKLLTYAIFLFVLVFSSGCTTLDKMDMRALTKFEPIAEHGTYQLWRYETIAPPLQYGLDEAGENTRMKWLISYLQMNNMPVNYEVVEKKVIKTGDALVGPIYTIIYTIKIIKDTTVFK